MSESVQIIDTHSGNILDYGICGYKNLKRDGYQEKIEWLKYRFSEGLKIKTLYSETDGTQGMIEYIPGEFCWRPVKAKGYMFIHCIFLGFKKKYKGQGYGALLLGECINDAQRENFDGVAVVTRKGAFMAGKQFFLKNGFELVDQAHPDFELLAKKFSRDALSPVFNGNWEDRLAQYGRGLTIIRADQCPYTVKNVREIKDIAEKRFGTKTSIITLKNFQEAQDSPSPFGVFCIIYNGKVIVHHPISKTRFVNIMNTLKKENLGKSEITE
ncbi:MAG: YoaP domain-containing protein [Candidatus Aminicenantes bacterium]|nr:YoaP domain-containing protein [Candidatus Aminicenantes bacterium]